MARRESDFTTILWDLDPESGKLLPYVRLIPSFMDMENHGRAWGFAIGGGFRQTKEEAEEFADNIDAFLKDMCEQYSNLGK